MHTKAIWTNHFPPITKAKCLQLMAKTLAMVLQISLWSVWKLTSVPLSMKSLHDTQNVLLIGVRVTWQFQLCPCWKSHWPSCDGRFVVINSFYNFHLSFLLVVNEVFCNVVNISCQLGGGGCCIDLWMMLCAENLNRIIYYHISY